MSTKQQSLFLWLAYGGLCSHPSICIPRPSLPHCQHGHSGECCRQRNILGSISRLYTSFWCFLAPTCHCPTGSHFVGPWQSSSCSSLHNRSIAILLSDCCPPLALSTPPDVLTFLLVFIHIADVFLVESANSVLGVTVCDCVICRPRGAAKQQESGEDEESETVQERMRRVKWFSCCHPHSFRNRGVDILDVWLIWSYTVITVNALTFCLLSKNVSILLWVP